MRKDAEHALMLALTYIRYIREEYPEIHIEANGVPKIDEEIKQTLKGIR